MIRLVIALLLPFVLSAAVWAADDIEAQIARIEQLSINAPWQESQALIDALKPRLAAFTPLQRERIEMVRLRNLALSGDQADALSGLTTLLEQPLPPAMRVSAYSRAINLAANLEDWSRAFTWLGEALPLLAQAPEESSRMLGIASYLYTLVDEYDKARELALRSRSEAEKTGDLVALCRALSTLALAEEHADHFAIAEDWRRRQVDACVRAHDLVFMANGKYGVGKMALRQGNYTQALDWLGQARADFQATAYVAGVHSVELAIAETLIDTRRTPERVQTLLDDALRYYQGQPASFRAIAETEELLARLAEQRGDAVVALTHLKRAMAATAQSDKSARERRLAYMQVQFDTRLKEQQIALLENEKELVALHATATRRWQQLLIVGAGGLLATAILLGILLRRTLRERHRYRWQSQHDGLTGLHNYQQVRQLGDAAFARARSHDLPFTAVVIDIDLFKQVNDRYGHAAGDEALCSLGAWISDAVGWNGIAGRSGGDEFTVLLNGDAAQAEAMLEDLRRRIEPIVVFGQTFRFNISSGVCEADARTSTLAQLIHEADQALYRAKHAGRDRIMHANGDAPGEAAAAGLVVVGSGIQFGRHASERCLSEIREAQVVFCLADPYTLGMVREMRPDVINLGTHYAPGKDRRDTYREIDAAIMASVRAGKRVCAVFYGHPGVFADVPHQVIRKALAEGVAARMEPGISAEACLYADLGIDPGEHGVQSMEATHFLVNDRKPDPSGLVLLWQVALSGDLSCRRLHAEPAGLQALVDKLRHWYPDDHEVILYEAAQLPIQEPRAQRLRLRELPSAHYEEFTTLVIPPLVEA